MTWDDLRAFLNDLHQRCDERLGDTVTVYDRTLGEFYPSDLLEFTKGDDVLDDNSIFIQIDT